MLETITTDYEFAGYGVTGIKMPVPEMKEKIKDVELLISEFEDITKEVIDAAEKLKIIVCCRNEAFASIDIEAATAKGIPVLRAGGRNAIAVAEHTIALLMCVSKNMSLTDHLLKYTDQLTNVQVESVLRQCLSGPWIRMHLSHYMAADRRCMARHLDRSVSV